MANLTKIILGLNIAVAVFGLIYGLKFVPERLEEQVVKKVKTEKDRADEANGKMGDLEDAKAALKKRFTDKDAEHKDIKAQYDQLSGNINSKDVEFADLQQANSTLSAKNKSLKTANDGLQAKADESDVAQAKLVAAKKEIDALTTELDKIKNPTAAVEPRTPTATAGGKVGHIANVDPRNGSIILNRGSAHGFKIGDQFNVFRNNKLIGRIEVTRLSSTNTGLSIAQRMEGLGVPAGAQFQVNDDLIKFQ